MWWMNPPVGWPELNRALTDRSPTPGRGDPFGFPGDGGVKVPPGTFEVRNPTAKPATLFIARFSRNGIKAGQVPPQAAALLGSPDNRGDADLRLKTDSVTLTVCR